MDSGEANSLKWHYGSACSRGHRWGCRLRVTMDQPGKPLRPWPAWESEEAAKVRAYCRKLVRGLAREEAVIEQLARAAAGAAQKAYETFTLEEARSHLPRQKSRDRP